MIRQLNVALLISMLLLGCSKDLSVKNNELPRFRVSSNQRFLEEENGEPFFWLGDTGWLLFTRLSREEAEAWFDDRAAKGFNLLQVSLIHTLNAKNYYGDSALIHQNLARPLIKEGEYDYWDHVDYLVDLAAQKGLYMGLVPVWGNNVRFGGVSYQEAEIYAHWLADRYGDRSHIVWLNGGDTFGSDSTAIWKVIGRTLKEKTVGQLVTFHPRGRCSSSDWFQEEEWLDFNMIQSGHRRYDQDDTERGYGQDNWRFVKDDYEQIPVKPTLDAEPSYEGIPQGWHDPNEGYWDHNDVRRYAYWSVFAGAFGFTYGHNAIMQFYRRGVDDPAFGVLGYWDTMLNSIGSNQMKHLKKLMLSKPYFDRVPAQELLAENGEKYDYTVATRGENYAMIYSYRGGIISVDLSKIKAETVAASWFCPRTGAITTFGSFSCDHIQHFDAPDDPEDGNDWVLILDSL